MKLYLSIIVALIVLVSTIASAQWRKIADFNGEYITCVYFLDLPGQPRIGFVGIHTELYKTTNGGISWQNVWGGGLSYDNYYVTDICFKDSMTGWFSIFGSTDACYRTMDGGNSWTKLPVPGSNYGALAVYYRTATNRLFLSMADDSGMKFSNDLGNTWRTITSIETGGISFSTDLNGIAAAYPQDTGYWIVRTTNGGLTWDSIRTSAYCQQPLTCTGTHTCFAVTWIRTIIYRSDDDGQTWKVLKDFGPIQDSHFNRIAPYGSGVIRGNISRLYIQTDSGMYVSTNEGMTWENDGGPTLDGGSYQKFYSSKGVTIAGMTYNGGGVLEDGGLWEEDTAQASVAEQPGANTISGLYVTENPFTNSTAIKFTLADYGLVTFQLFDVLGHAVTTNGIGQVLYPGAHEFDIDGSKLAPGNYIARVAFHNGDVESIIVVKK